jgi:hypothetical protein
MLDHRILTRLKTLREPTRTEERNQKIRKVIHKPGVSIEARKFMPHFNR